MVFIPLQPDIEGVFMVWIKAGKYGAGLPFAFVPLVLRVFDGIQRDTVALDVFLRCGGSGGCVLIRLVNLQYQCLLSLGGGVIAFRRDTCRYAVESGIGGQHELVGKTRPSVINRPIVGFPVHQCYDRLDVRRLAGVGQYLIGGIPRNRGRGLADGEGKFYCTLERCAGDSDFCRIPGIDIVVVGHGIVIRRRQRLPVHGDGNAGFLFFAVIGQSQIIWQRNRQLCPTDASTLCEITLLRNRLRSAEGAGLGVGGGP